jgi:xanthine dehydrogenase small subunit
MLGARIDVAGRRIAGARIAYGGMAATPKRAANTERALIGTDLDARETWRVGLDALASDFMPLTDQRATAAYRRTAAAAVLEKTLIEIAGVGAPTRIGALHATE